MAGPRCFCAHGLRVEKGVQSVRLTERCGRNSRVAQQRGGSRGRCGGTARNTKTKSKGKMSRGFVCPSMQSNRQQQNTQLQYQKSVPKGPKLNSHTRLRQHTPSCFYFEKDNKNPVKIRNAFEVLYEVSMKFTMNSGTVPDSQPHS